MKEGQRALEPGQLHAVEPDEEGDELPEAEAADKPTAVDEIVLPSVVLVTHREERDEEEYLQKCNVLKDNVLG